MDNIFKYSLTSYKEFNPSDQIVINGKTVKTDFPRLIDNISEKPLENKGLIINYLKKGRATFSTPGIAKDMVTGDRIGIEFYGQTDGVYTWNSLIPYYAEKYNLKLPEHFIDHCLKQ